MSIYVEIFSSPGCRKCGRANDVLKKITEDIGGDCIHWRTVNILEEMDYAVTLGVLATPAIAVDGELIITALPSEKKLRKILEKKLNESCH
ncbi:MAG TPA: thioredoxin family protein [Acidiferrobacteraceae bacterium]|nr:thioredoxin family protein [Acidiferrobacteraceae bacterium]